MTSVRTLALAAALTTVSAVAANAQAAWPNSQPQQAAWPSSRPQPQRSPHAPNSSRSRRPHGRTARRRRAAPPQQAPWPASAPPGSRWPRRRWAAASAAAASAAVRQPAAQQECVGQFTALRSEVEKRGMAAKAGGEKQVPREEMCKLVTDLQRGRGQVDQVRRSQHVEMRHSETDRRPAQDRARQDRRRPEEALRRRPGRRTGRRPDACATRSAPPRCRRTSRKKTRPAARSTR